MGLTSMKNILKLNFYALFVMHQQRLLLSASNNIQGIMDVTNVSNVGNIWDG